MTGPDLRGLPSTMPLSDRAALVTGAARGIGRAIAELFRQRGARVVTVDRDPLERGGEVASAEDGFHVTYDLVDTSALPDLVAEATQLVGPIDILVNCAALQSNVGVAEMSVDHLDTVMRVNVHAPIMLTRAVLPAMIARGYGRVVNIDSVHGLRGAAGHLAYDVSKAALLGATRSIALEVARAGILVNAVAPGFVDTRATDLTSESYHTVYLHHRRLPIGRAAEPAEIAEVTAWLASQANSYVTGQCVVADGGLVTTL